MKKPYLIAGIILIALAAIWRFGIAPQKTLRVPKDWSMQAEYLGDLNYADENGVIPEKRDINVYKRNWFVKEWSSDRAVIRDIYKTYDIITGKITWAAELDFEVDPKTGKNLSYPGHPEAAGTYYFFPQNAAKQDYPAFESFLYPLTFKFDRIEKLAGLEIYVYRFRGDINFDEGYKGTDEYPGFKAPLGQTIIGFGVIKEIWVEPRTGEMVKLLEDSPGDYYTDVKTKKKIAGISAWKGETTGNTVELLVDRAKDIIFTLNLHRLWIPGVLFFSGVLLILLGVVRKKQVSA